MPAPGFISLAFILSILRMMFAFRATRDLTWCSPPQERVQGYPIHGLSFVRRWWYIPNCFHDCQWKRKKTQMNIGGRWSVFSNRPVPSFLNGDLVNELDHKVPQRINETHSILFLIRIRALNYLSRTSFLTPVKQVVPKLTYLSKRHAEVWNGVWKTCHDGNGQDVFCTILQWSSWSHAKLQVHGCFQMDTTDLGM